MRAFDTLTKYEKIWLIVFSSLIMASTIIFSWMYTDWSSKSSIILNCVISPVSALTGVLCVMMCAKGHISNWWLGVVNAASYGLIAWISGYYGDWIMNWFFFLPTQFFILYYWKKNMANKDTKIVKMRRLTPMQIAIVCVLGVVFLVGFGLILSNVDWWFVNVMRRNESIYATINVAIAIPLIGPLLDSSTEVFQILGQVLLIKRYAEQWLMWIVTDIITVVMWAIVLIVEPKNAAWVVPTLIMWIAYLVNCVYGYHNWYKNSKVAV